MIELRKYEYIGDVNLEYGGIYINLDDWEDGYCDAVEVIDLDSGCGWDGAVVIQRKTILVDDEKIVRQSLDCCGCDADPADVDRLDIAYAVNAYGYSDDDGPGEFLQTDPDAPRTFNTWEATTVLDDSEDLREYIERVYWV